MQSRAHIVLVILTLTAPAVLGAAVPSEVEDLVESAPSTARTEANRTTATVLGSLPGTIGHGARTASNESMNETARLLGTLNDSFALVNTQLETLAVEGLSNETRATAIGQIRIAFETVNGTLLELRNGVVHDSGQHDAGESANTTLEDVVGAANLTLKTINETVGHLPGTARGAGNATFGVFNSTAGPTRAGAGASANTTRETTVLPQIEAVVLAAESVRAAFFANLDTIEPTPTGLARLATGAASSGFDAVAGAKNATVNSTLFNTTTNTPFGVAYTALAEITTRFALVNNTLRGVGEATNASTRQDAFNAAFLVQETINRSALDVVLAAIESGGSGPAHDARDAAFSRLTDQLIQLNDTLSGVISTVKLRQDETTGSVDGNGTVTSGSESFNATRDDATGPRLDALLGVANATRVEVAAALLALAAQVGPHALEAIPSVPETLAESNVPALTITYPVKNGYNQRMGLKVNFTTSLPMAASGPGFEAAYAIPGTGAWIYAGRTACAGDAGQTRSCEIEWLPELQGKVTIRVAPGNFSACYTGQCASVSGVTLDDVKPITTLNASFVVPTTVRDSDTFQIDFRTEPHARVHVNASQDGAPEISLGSVVADANGDATFGFNRPGEPGEYRIFANATDRAGNRELTSSTPKLSFHVVSGVSVTVERESIYWRDGQTPTIEACLKIGPVDVDADAGAIVTMTVDGGAALPMTHHAGCTWKIVLPEVDVLTFTKVPFTIDAAVDGILGDLNGHLTYTPARLVSLRVDTVGEAWDYQAWVPVGDNAGFGVIAVYNDTGEPARLLDIAATGAGDPIQSYSDFDGLARYDLASPPGVAVVNLAFTATHEYSNGLPTPVTVLGTSTQVVWTRLVATLEARDTASGHTDVGDRYQASYRIAWAHDTDLVVPDASLGLLDPSETNENFDSPNAGENGVATVEISNNTVVAKVFDVTAFYDYDEITFFADATGEELHLNFTRVVAQIGANVTHANVGAPYDFGVTAHFEHNPALPAAGALFQLRVDDDVERVIGNVTAGADGIAFGHHTFLGTFHDNISVRLAAPLAGVSLQAGPIDDVTVISTQLIVDSLTVSDRDVQPGQTVTATVALRYAHNLDTDVDGAIQFTGTIGAMPSCPLVDGAATCPLDSANIASTAFSMTVLTSDGIHVVLGGTPSTAVVNWTRLAVVAGAPSSTLSDVGATINLPINVSYAHDGAVKAASTLIQARNGSTLLGSCTTDAEGRCGLPLLSHAVSSSTISVTAATNPLDVVEMTAPVTTPVVTWTKLLVTYTNDVGPFNTGKGANYEITVRYAHDQQLVQGAVVSLAGLSTGLQSNVTDVNGQARVTGIEWTPASRSVTVYARVPSLGLLANETDGQPATLVHRWTAIGFRAFSFDPEAERYNATDGGPIYPTGTAVTVCTIVVEADTDTPLAGASVTLRGIARVSGPDGSACITIAASSQVRNVSVTAKGTTVEIEGKTITSTVTRRTTLHFTNDP